MRSRLRRHWNFPEVKRIGEHECVCVWGEVGEPILVGFCLRSFPYYCHAFSTIQDNPGACKHLKQLLGDFVVSRQGTLDEQRLE